MKTKLALIVLWMSATALFAKSHTPAPGSPERKTICDAMRAYVRQVAFRPITQSFLFKVECLFVDGDYAGFEGFPVNADGTTLPAELTGDLVYATLLKRVNGEWRVVTDLTRSDVPSDEEVREIRKRVPADFPRSAMPEYWRKLLRP
jgi:hypothetical protein